MNPFDKFVTMYSRLPTETDPDYLELLRMSKYRILAVPDVQPGKCINCGSSKQDGRGYIDIGLQIEWFGAAIFCGLCVTDIARNLGLFKVYEDKIKQLEQVNSDFLAGAKTAEELEDRFLLVFQEVKEYLDSIRPSGDGPTPNSNPNVDTDKAATESGTNTPERTTKRADSGTTKQATSSGSKNVHSLTDLLESES